jgi:energy-coupling factor transport system ATP-binding protein
MKMSFQNVFFAYERFGESSTTRRPQLRGISFEIGEAEFVAIVGRSGSGKTTLMQMFNGLLKPVAGRVLADGADIHARGYDLTGLRTRVGLAFQFPEAQLFGLTVAEDIAFGPAQQKREASAIGASVLASLQQAGLPEDFLTRNPMTLSQGEKRRVALAGILVMNTDMLVLDEPTASLDAAGVAHIKQILRDWHRQGKTVVIVSHDMDLVAELADRVLVLQEGEIVFDGKPEKLWGDGRPCDHHEGHDRSPAELLARTGLAVPRAVRLRHLLAEKKIPESLAPFPLARRPG